MGHILLHRELVPERIEVSSIDNRILLESDADESSTVCPIW